MKNAINCRKYAQICRISAWKRGSVPLILRRLWLFAGSFRPGIRPARSRKCRNGVGPGLHGSDDVVALIRGNPDLVAAEGHVVDFPGGVVALQLAVEGVLCGVADGGPGGGCCTVAPVSLPLHHVLHHESLSCGSQLYIGVFCVDKCGDFALAPGSQTESHAGAGAVGVPGVSGK